MATRDAMEQRKASEQGVFLGACNSYAYVARRPGGDGSEASLPARSRS